MSVTYCNDKGQNKQQEILESLQSTSLHVTIIDSFEHNEELQNYALSILNTADLQQNPSIIELVINILSECLPLSQQTLDALVWNVYRVRKVIKHELIAILDQAKIQIKTIILSLLALIEQQQSQQQQEENREKVWNQKLTQWICFQGNKDIIIPCYLSVMHRVLIPIDTTLMQWISNYLCACTQKHFPYRSAALQFHCIDKAIDYCCRCEERRKIWKQRTNTDQFGNLTKESGLNEILDELYKAKKRKYWGINEEYERKLQSFCRTYKINTTNMEYLLQTFILQMQDSQPIQHFCMSLIRKSLFHQPVHQIGKLIGQIGLKHEIQKQWVIRKANILSMQNNCLKEELLSAIQIEYDSQ